MTDYSTHRRGGVELPLPLAADTGNGMLRDADPGLYYALEYLKHVAEKTIGERLLEVAARLEVPICSPVAMTTSLDPKPMLEQQYAEFPLLAVYRTKSVENEKTMTQRHDVCAITIEYILPPLAAGIAEAIVPILAALAKAFDHWVDQGWDPDFTPSGGVLGDQPFGAELAGVEDINLTGATWGLYPGQQGLPFYALMMTGELLELDNLKPEDFEEFVGADVDASVATSTEPEVVVSEISTLPEPTVVSIAPTSGSYAGGDTVTVTGTNFRAPMFLYFAGVELVPTVASSTSLTFETPAVSDAWVGEATDITVERDGMLGTLADAFTFTA